MLMKLKQMKNKQLHEIKKLTTTYILSLEQFIIRLLHWDQLQRQW